MRKKKRWRSSGSTQSYVTALVAAAALVTGLMPLGIAASPAAAAQPIIASQQGPAKRTGIPNENNTGVPAGKKLRVHNGNLTITKAGTVVDGLDVRGFVDVQAPRVTIRNTIVRGGASKTPRGLVQVATKGADLTIYDSELNAAAKSPNIDGLRGFNIKATRIKIANVVDNAHLWAPGNVSIQWSLLHKTAYFKNDPNQGGGESHNDNVQLQSGSNFKIERNRLTGANIAAVIITQDMGPVSKSIIGGNWIDGGSCAINISEKKQGPVQGVRVLGNKFTNDGQACWVIRPKGGSITVADNWSEAASAGSTASQSQPDAQRRAGQKQRVIFH